MASTVTLQVKINSPFRLIVKQGVDPVIGDIQNLTFNDVMLPDGTLVKNATFKQLQNTLWTLPNKNNDSFTLQNKN